jgi:maleate isomerase
MAHELIKSRARIGLMIASENAVAEEEFHRYRPKDIEICLTRARVSSRHRDGKPFEHLLAEVEMAAVRLNDARCEVIGVHCTGASMSNGVDGDQAFVDRIRKAVGKPATTAAIGVSAALRHFGAKRIVFMTKMDDAVRDYEGAYLRGAGFEIIGGRGAGAPNDTCHAFPPEFWYDATMACRDDSADAYFITCTNVRAMGAIEALEKDLGKPVVSSNQALLWHALRTAGVKDSIPNLGSLLRVVDSRYARAAE